MLLFMKITLLFMERTSLARYVKKQVTMDTTFLSLQLEMVHEKFFLSMKFS